MSTPVIVNVGGTRFQTTIETLRNCPGRGDRSIFRHMNISCQEETFVDRDPTVFGYILNYLRDGSVIFPKDGYILTLAKYEAEHYGLHYLYKHLPTCDNLHIVEAEWDSEDQLFRSPSYGHSEPSPDTEWMSSPVFPANLNHSNAISSLPSENSHDSDEITTYECQCRENRVGSSPIPPSVHPEYLDDSGSVSPLIFTYHRGRIDHE
ncbi:unnamed protein product [Cylicostephanus goldi]|uniref:Potassium channel tetramerisation-type BTB domain-containing protein n=1 Tax=Cylicostephanus goldi TaxID=71465 RepID=A0A3P6STP5_CYLGO|nr:unnamed protein product [Cylicostephanus goldi]